MYRITLTRAAQRQLTSLPEVERGRIIAAIRGLELNPRPPGCVRLTGEPFWRIRVGSYRMIYEIDDPQSSVLVVRVMHRREVYR